MDEDDAVRQHKQYYGGEGSSRPATSGGLGGAAAMYVTYDTTQWDMS
jgi:hypothetical protein